MGSVSHKGQEIQESVEKVGKNATKSRRNRRMENW